MPHAAQDSSMYSPEETDQEAQNEGHLSIRSVIPLSPECQESHIPQFAPPSARDRGYAWVVVTSVFWINTLCAGYIKSFGITYLLLLEYFPDASGAAAGWIMGLLIGTRGILSPLMGALSVKMGSRWCILAGTLVLTLGLLLAIPAFSISYMAITMGGLVGIGLCMSETPGILLVTDYFVEKRSFANGIRAAGNPMGGILFSPMVVFLKEQYGLQGTFLIMAGIMLHLAVFGMLIRPIELQEQILQNRHRRNTHLCLENMVNAIEKNQIARSKPLPRKTLDFTLFKNPQYLLYLVMSLSVNLALPNGVLYMPAYGHSLGLTNYQTSIIASYLSGTDCILRVLCGFLVQKLHLNVAYVFIAGLLVGGVGCLVVTLCTNMWQLMLATTLYSFGLAIFWALINTLLANDFGAESIASSWGFFRMVQGVTSFIYPSFLGLVKDLTGSLVVPFLIMGGGFILAGIIFSLQPLIAKITRMRMK